MSSKFFTNKQDNKINTKGKSKATKQKTTIKPSSVQKAGRGNKCSLVWLPEVPFVYLGINKGYAIRIFKLQ